MVKKRKQNSKPKKSNDLKTIAIWTPRILMILFTILIGLFAFDSFQNYSGAKLVFALGIQLIPALLLSIFLIIAWKWEIIGGGIIIALGVIFGIFFSAFQSLSGFLTLVLPLWLIGILFWISYRLKANP